MAESNGVWYITQETYQQLQNLANGNWGSDACPFESTDFNNQLGSMFPALEGCWYATKDEIDPDELEWADENGIVIGFAPFQNSGQAISILP